MRIRSAELRNAGAWWARVHQAANPLAFMVVDAEVVDRNVIRLDTDNVLDIVLTPGAALIDPAKPVQRGVERRGARHAHAGRRAAPDQQHVQAREAAQDAGAAGL